MNIRPFPRKEKNDDLYYDELDNHNKKIVLVHLKRAGKINMWTDIQQYLCRQIQNNKSKRLLTRYKPYCQLVDHYYKNYLLINNFDLFDFKNHLENALCKEMTTDKMNRLNIYFSHELKPDDLKFSDFDKNEWKLSISLDMTNNDIAIMEKFKNNLLLFLEECLQVMHKFNSDSSGICLRKINFMEKKNEYLKNLVN